MPAGGGLGPLSRKREQGDKAGFMKKMEDNEPGYGRTERARKGQFLRKEGEVYANMQCPANNCRQIRHIKVADEHQDQDEGVMAATIMKHGEKAVEKSPYRCGTCRTPLVMYDPPQERLHDREEI